MQPPIQGYRFRACAPCGIVAASIPDLSINSSLAIWQYWAA
jgi:hypothetical protein